MTKEISDIVKAFKIACHEGRRTALATVVCVEGSSYRMPGARMLVEDNGAITGAISGGCLEGDALRKALQAINQQQNKLVTYNSLEAEDMEFGLQLGCNGIVHIIFEPIDASLPHNPVAVLENYLLKRKEAVLVTLFSFKNRTAAQPGTCFFLNSDISKDKIQDPTLADIIRQEANEVLENRASLLKQYAGYELSAFFEFLQPPVSLVIVGAGNDAMPLVKMATVLGWQITIIDGRVTHANKKRFPNVHKLIVGKPEDVIGQIAIDSRTVFVLMTHNYNYDQAIVKTLLLTKSKYIGLLGPKKRWETMHAALAVQGTIVTDEQNAKVFGPTGLDIGAETPEEIALSILAEIKTVMAGHQGGSLRLRNARIHSRPSLSVLETNNFF